MRQIGGRRRFQMPLNVTLSRSTSRKQNPTSTISLTKPNQTSSTKFDGKKGTLPRVNFDLLKIVITIVIS